MGSIVFSCSVNITVILLYRYRW